jgi:SNF2 family DNA or RNA helicase
MNNGCGKIVFCQFRGELQEIKKKLLVLSEAKNQDPITKMPVYVIDGSTSAAQRATILSEAQLRPAVLFMQMQSGCEGLNLQRWFSEVYFPSRSWNPAMEQQAIARCLRHGQTKPVFVVRFQMESLGSDTVNADEYVEATHQKKCGFMRALDDGLK